MTNGTRNSSGLMTIKRAEGAPSLVDAARQIGLDAIHLDHVYGVVPVDPVQGLYAVKVKPGAPAAGATPADARGPWSDPTIEPFGLE